MFPGSPSVNDYSSWAKGHDYYIKAVHAFKPESPQEHTQIILIAEMKQSEIANATLDVFCKINTVPILFSKQYFIKRKSTTILKYVHLKVTNYHTYQGTVTE